MISDERALFLLHNAPKLFSRLLEQLMLASILSQGQLSREATAFRQGLIDQGLMELGDPLIGSMHRTTINNIIAERLPTYGQVWIWLRMIKNWYANPQMKEDLKKYNLPEPEIDDEIWKDMQRLALHGTLEEIDEAYKRRENLDLLEDRPVIRDPRTYFLPSMKQKLEQETDHDMRSWPNTDEISLADHIRSLKSQQHQH